MNTYNGFNPFMQQQPPQMSQMNTQLGNMQNPSSQKNTASRKPKPRQQNFINIETPENVKKEIVIFNWTEPTGINNPEKVDSDLVQQILSSIVERSLNIKYVKRLGKFNYGKPRRIVVLLNSIKDQKLVIANVKKLENFQGWQHLSIQPYRPLNERNENTWNHDPKDSKTAKFFNPFANFASEESSSQRKQINILVIGATGVGKSTWINGIANYMSFNTFDDALNAKKPLCLIPMSFMEFIGNKQINVSMASMIGKKDANEAESRTGQSCTQEPKIYQYITDTVAFNLIDTPGICDTRGIEADIKNIKMIMECMSQWDEIHGICLLLKPDQHRLIHPFRYCIQELLINLHKSAIQNIAVVFTNARSTFYKPSGTMDILRQLFEDVKNATGSDIPLKDTFCIDNEAVKTLYSKHKGLKIDKNIIDNAADSWNRTVKETYRLFKYFSVVTADMIPHLTYETKVTTQIREMLMQLCTVMANTNEEIIQSRIILDERNKHLKVLQTNLENRKNLTYQGEYVENSPLPYPVTVCCGQSCFETVKSLSSETPDKFFKKPCCKPCPLKSVNPEHIGHVNLRQCEAFGSNGCCKSCGCSWQLHMHFWYSQKKVMGNFSSSTNQEAIDALNTEILFKEHSIYCLQKDLKSLEQLNEKVLKLCHPFYKFLAENSIITFNTAYEDYLNLDIKESEKSFNTGEDPKKLERLQKLLAIHQQLKCVISSPTDKNLNNYNEKITMMNYVERISNIHEILGLKLPLVSNHRQFVKPLSEKTITCYTKIEQFET